MFEKLKASFRRKKARRVFAEYPYKMVQFDLETDGIVEFADWDNPLTGQKTITQKEIDFFRKFVKNGDLAIDIGANIGDTTVPMAIAAGKEGLVLGFDPNPYIFKILQQNATLNKGKANIVPLQCAITDTPGEFYYNSSEASFSNGGISREPNTTHGKFQMQHTVRGVNLSALLHKDYESWLEKLSLIKVDTEGLDKEIIKSISDVIKTCKPVIIAECFLKLSKEEKEELYDIIHDHGYDLFYFEDFLEDTTIEKLSREDMNKSDTFNLYAIPKN
ncbi:FkbM family methyltransferase [Fulvivirgaceae bacterium BMA12]|uniref:FkbM family methyltransferase n=1 Tax=Agaribacillus aureus TaxID=3051825 RepID=A0ABT8LFI1_9BACT|nr:FkbM family methyltransferase [Fulvivirgaceae bacterium BMA12]